MTSATRSSRSTWSGSPTVRPRGHSGSARPRSPRVCTARASGWRESSLVHSRQGIVDRSPCRIAADTSFTEVSGVGMDSGWGGAAGREDQRAVGELGFGAGGRAALAGSAAGDGQLGGGEQFALVVADEQVVLAGEGEVERGGDVLVGVAVGHRDRAAEESELVVGADEADELDRAPLGPAGGQFGERARQTRIALGGGLLGRQASGGAVAVLGVVEAFERAGALGQVVDAGEAFGAEEPLLEGVVEVLDRAIAPRLPGRDEHRGGALVQAHADDLA